VPHPKKDLPAADLAIDRAAERRVAQEAAMRRIHVYRAVLVKDAPDSVTLGVVFPELPGCISAGDDLDDAVRMAHEALALHLEGMIADGEALPGAVGLDAPLPDWLVEDGPVIETGRVPVRVEVAVEAVPA
jgi:predicted RNase H-like HicB family nuclease